MIVKFTAEGIRDFGYCSNAGAIEIARCRFHYKK